MFLIIVLMLMLMISVVILSSCDRNISIAKQIPIELNQSLIEQILGENQFAANIAPLTVNEDTMFVHLRTQERVRPRDRASGFDYVDGQHIAKINVDGTDFRILRTMKNEVRNDSESEFFHIEILTGSAQRPDGGMVALIAEEEVYVEFSTDLFERKIDTYLVFFAPDGVIEREVPLTRQLPHDVGGLMFGKSMQVLDDGRIVFSDMGKVFVFSPNGNVERVFEIELESFVIVEDGRMVATLFNFDKWEWYTRYFDLNTGLLIESDENVIPREYRSGLMFPGVSYDLYSVAFESVYGIDLDSGKVKRLFRWADADTQAQEVVMSEIGAFYFIGVQETEIDGEIQLAQREFSLFRIPEVNSEVSGVSVKITNILIVSIVITAILLLILIVVTRRSKVAKNTI